jgi:hypothetical protein
MTGENDSNSLGRGNEDDYKSIKGVLNRTKIYLSGTFDMELEDLRDKITENGGRISKTFTEDVQLVVMGENPSERDREAQRRFRTKWITLGDLQGIIEGTMPLNNVSASPGKVSFGLNAPRSYVHPLPPQPSTSASKMVFPSNFPKRIPSSRTTSPRTPSTLTNQSVVSFQIGTTPETSPPPGVGKKVATFKYTTILTARMRFSQVEKPGVAIPEAIQNLLTAFKEVDQTVKFRHLEREDRVYATRDDIPPLRYMYDTMVYFNGAKPASLQPYSNPKEDRMRNVSFTIRVGSSMMMKDIRDECTWTLKDVVKGGDIFIEIKPLQHVKTESPFILIAVPTNCSGEDLANTLGQFIQNGVSQAKRKKPEKYKYLPDVVPTFALTTEFIKGIPYSADDDNKSDNIPLWMRKPWHIMIKTEDDGDFKSCLGLVERMDNFHRMCSGGAFIIEHKLSADARLSDDEVKTLKAFLHRHIWAMKNTG